MPFRVAAALEAGMTHDQLHAGFTRVIEGVYVASNVRVTPRIRARAMLLVHPPDAVISHDTALRVLGAPIDLDPCEHVTVTRREDRRPRRAGRSHAMSLRLKDVGDLGGLPGTVPERTFIDMARRLPLVELVVLGDWLVTAGHTTPETLVAFCAESPARYAARSLAAARYVRRGSASPQESRTRMLLVLAGLPEPDLDEKWRDEDGTVFLQSDMVYLLSRAARDRPVNGPFLGIAVDYDGLVHLDSRQQWEKDVERADRYAALRIQPLRVTARGLNRDAGTTLRRVHGALAALRWPGLEPLRDDWRQHFAG